MWMLLLMSLSEVMATQMELMNYLTMSLTKKTSLSKMLFKMQLIQFKLPSIIGTMRRMLNRSQKVT